jgi:hypothetical protein
LIVLEVAYLILEEVTTYMEYLYALLIVSLNGNSREEHMSYLAESKSGVRVDKIDLSWRYIDIPLCKVSAHQNEKINDI